MHVLKIAVIIAIVAFVGLAPVPAGAAGTAPNPAGGVEVTIYNDDLALVKERRQLEIPKGISTLVFRDISARINPATVSFRSLTAPGSVRVLEQNFEFDLVEDAKLLQKFIGQRITVRTRSGEVFTGYLLSGARNGVPGNIVMSSEPDGAGSVVTVHLGDIQSVEYPSLPEGLITTPTLAWIVNNASSATAHETMITYLTGGLSWSADYVAVVGPNDDVMDITGWITLTNQSGTAYRDAKVKLVAGDVNRVYGPEPYPVRAAAAKVMYDMALAEVAEREFADYHLYELPLATTLKDNQVKQVEFMSATDVKVKKLLIYDGAQMGTKVASMLEFWNKEEDGLGLPLPKGIIRVSKADADGSLEFAGEDRIDHTPVDEKVRITLGYAFDVVGERKLTNTKRISDRVSEETWEIEVRNRKNVPVEVLVIEHMYGGTSWELVRASTRNYNKLDANTLEFPVEVKAGSTATISYTVRYSR